MTAQTADPTRIKLHADPRTRRLTGFTNHGFVPFDSARDQVDGFGNAVSPQVGAWIGSRLRAILDTPEGCG